MLALLRQTSYKYNHLQAGFMSSSAAACSVAREAGMTILPQAIPNAPQGQATNSIYPPGWTPPVNLAQTAMHVLGFDTQSLTQTTDTQHASQSNVSNEDDIIDMLMLHISQPAEQADIGTACSGHSQTEGSNSSKQEGQQTYPLSSVTQQHAGTIPNAPNNATSSIALCSWLNELLAFLWSIPSFHQSIILVLLLTNPCSDDPKVQASRITSTVFEGQDFPQVAKPLQSHCISNMKAVPQCCSQTSLMVQHLPGVVRRDKVQKLSLSDIVATGGGCCILAEHILPELAYKLGRAAKYGA